MSRILSLRDVKRTYAEHVKAKDATCLGQWCLFSGPEQHLKREALAALRQEAREAGGGQRGGIHRRGNHDHQPPGV